jgi:hypothetical protein
MKWLRFSILGLVVLGAVLLSAAGLPYGRFDWVANAQPYGPPNLALNERAVASSWLQNHPPSWAVDGDPDTSWMSTPYYSHQQWFYVVLDRYQPVSEIVIDWPDDGYARYYQVSVLRRIQGGQYWQAVNLENAGDGGVDTIDFPAISTVAVLVQMWGRPFESNSFGIDELQVFYIPTGPQGPTNLAAGKPTYATSYRADHLPQYATDADLATSWQPLATGRTSPAIYVDLGDTYDVSEADIYWLGASSVDYRLYVWTFVWYGWYGRWTWYPVYAGSATGDVSTATFRAINARYVLLQVRGSTDFGVSEFEVYARQATSAAADKFAAPQAIGPADQQLPELVPPGWEDTPLWRQSPTQSKDAVPELVPADKAPSINR